MNIDLVSFKLVFDGKGPVTLIALQPLFVVVTDVALLSFLVEEPLVAEGTFLENRWVEL